MNRWTQIFLSRQELEKIQVLHFIQAFILQLYFLIASHFDVFFFVLFFASLFLQKAHWQMLKNLNYSFWPFSILSSLIYLKIFLDLTLFENSTNLGFLIFLGLSSLLAELYLISSPVYFPRVRWWEYDFRYRAEVKIQVYLNEEILEGRLTDLRRDAGCIVIFRKVSLSETMKITTLYNDEPVGLNVEMHSRKEPVSGRGFHYGVKFLFKDDKDKKECKKLQNLWKTNRKVRVRKKFKV